MIDILLLSLEVVAEEIAAANHKNLIIANKQLEGVLKLQTEDFVIIEEIEAEELIPAEEEDLPRWKAA